MSGNIHSGVQEVVLSSNSEPVKPLDEEPKDIFKDSESNMKDPGKPEMLGVLSTQVSTVSNASDGSLCCEICNIRVTSTKILQRHLEGRKHISRSERRGKTFQCELCDVIANSEIQLNIHLSSSKHKARVAREEYKEFTNISSFSLSIYVLLFCIFCVLLNLFILVKVGF